MAMRIGGGHRLSRAIIAARGELTDTSVRDHRRPGRLRHRTAPRRRGSTSTGASTSAGSRSTAGASTSSSSAPATAPSSSSTGSPARWQNWLENIPHFAAAPPRHRARPPGLRRLGRCPREKISIPGYGRFVDALLDRLGVGAGDRRRQLDGRLHRRRARDRVPGTASSGSCSSAPPGLTIEHQRNERVARRPAMRRAVHLGLRRGFVGARSDAVARRPRARRMLMRLVAAHPDQLPAAAGRRAGRAARASPASSTRSTR